MLGLVRRKKIKKTISEFLKELKNKKKFEVQKYMSLKEIQDVATQKGIPITSYRKIVTPGWIGQPKGLFQILYERGWINEEHRNEYSIAGKKHQLDESGEVKPEYRKFLLCHLMSACEDFCSEPTAMGQMLDTISS